LRVKNAIIWSDEKRHKAIRIFVTIPRDESLTHAAAVYIARSSDLIFVCLRCVCNSRYRDTVFALRPFLARASVISLKITSFSSGVARLPYLPSSCLISCYYVPRCRTSLARVRKDFFFSPCSSPKALVLSFSLSLSLFLYLLWPLTTLRSSFSLEQDYYFRLKCPLFRSR